MSPARTERPRGRVLLFPGGREDETDARADRLRDAGYDVVRGRAEPAFMREFHAAPPAAVVIDLSRSFSTGRDVALGIRQRKALRDTPLVLVDGEPSRLSAVRALLPDATFTSWGRVLGALRRAIARPRRTPARPPSLLAGYSGTPLPKKLGIKEGSTVVLLGAPRDFETTLGDLPAAVRISRRTVARAPLTLWFPASRRELERDIRKRGPAAAGGGLWIAWPKKASGVPTDLTESVVRGTGLANGLVDFKICAIDATWSALRFSLRRT